jgi:hypothetical protein
MIKNLTPHPIKVRIKRFSSLPHYDEEGWMIPGPSWDVELVFPPEGIVPRVETLEAPTAEVEGVPCITRRMGRVVDLPEPCEGVFYLVSSLVFEASDRPDLLCPDTGKTCVRDEHGNVIAVRRFIRKEAA